MNILDIFYEKTVGRIINLVIDVIKNYIEYIIFTIWLTIYIIIKFVDNILHTVYDKIGLSYIRDYEREDCKNDYPILLVHGLFGCENDSDSVFGLNYWNVINHTRRKLYDPYNKIFTIKLPPYASDEKRARYLSRAIDMFFYKQEKHIHIIAHSQGASTVRYMINHSKPHESVYCEKKMEYRDFVRSIVTINGSCKGSFIADMFFMKDENGFIRDKNTGQCIPSNKNNFASTMMRLIKYYRQLTIMFPLLKRSVYDLKWKGYISCDEIIKDIEDDLTKGSKSVEEIFGKYCDADLMEYYYNNRKLEHMEYIVNCKDNIPVSSLLSCNNTEPMYTYPINGDCRCYEKLKDEYEYHKTLCKCDRKEDKIKYLHVVGNVDTTRGILSYLPRIYPKNVACHDSLISGYSQSGYYGSECIPYDRKVYIKMDNLSYTSVIHNTQNKISDSKKNNSDYKIMEMPNLNVLHYLAIDDKIKIVCIGVNNMTHYDIAFPHLPFTYRKISNILGNVIKYVRFIKS